MYVHTDRNWNFSHPGKILKVRSDIETKLDLMVEKLRHPKARLVPAFYIHVRIYTSIYK